MGDSEGQDVRLAKALTAKGYRYQLVFAKNDVHRDHGVKAQTPSRQWSMRGRDMRPSSEPAARGASLRLVRNRWLRLL